MFFSLSFLILLLRSLLFIPFVHLLSFPECKKSANISFFNLLSSFLFLSFFLSFFLSLFLSFFLYSFFCVPQTKERQFLHHLFIQNATTISNGEKKKEKSFQIANNSPQNYQKDVIELLPSTNFWFYITIKRCNSISLHLRRQSYKINFVLKMINIAMNSQLVNYYYLCSLKIIQYKIHFLYFKNQITFIGLSPEQASNFLLVFHFGALKCLSYLKCQQKLKQLKHQGNCI
jgi:hypothetical protein